MVLLHAFCFVNPQPARDTSIGLSTHWVHRDEEKPVFHGEFPECRWKQTNQVIEVFYILADTYCRYKINVRIIIMYPM